MVLSRNIKETAAIEKAVEALRALLPDRWKVKTRPVQGCSDCFDASFEIVSPDGASATLAVDIKKQLYPKDAGWLITTYPDDVEPFSVIVVAPFLSDRVREKLIDLKLNFMDETGNVSILLDRPGLVISAQGAAKNPRIFDRGRPTLKGPKAGRIVRALVDFKPPVGIRELATRAGVDAGYASRVTRWLDEEDLIQREKRGKVTDVKWKELLQAWTRNYSFLDSNTVRTYLAPRGMEALKDKLRGTKMSCVVTGSLAAVEIAPFAPVRAAAFYSMAPDELADALELRPLEGGGSNAIIAVPFDPVVFERTTVRNGMACVAPGQLVADLMTGPGRNPAEAEELIKWMEKNEETWRA